MRPQQQPLPSTTAVTGVSMALVAALLVLAPVGVQAVDIFPPNEPSHSFDEDSSGAPGTIPGLPGSLVQYRWSNGSTGAGSAPLADAPSCGGGFWGTHLVETKGKAGSYQPSNRVHPLGPDGISTVFAIGQSIPTDPGWDPVDWTNFRFEFDFSAEDANGVVGLVWGGHDLQPVGDPDHLQLDHGYLFYIDELPSRADAIANGDRARWHLVRRQAGYDLELNSGWLELKDPSTGFDDLLSVYHSACYRIRLDFFCGTLKVQIAKINCGATDCTVDQCDGISTTTCSPEDYSSCDAGPIQWCDLLDWVDPEATLVPGIVGPFAGGMDNAADAVVRFDNLWSGTWFYDCNVVCPNPWSAWSSEWDPLQVGPEGIEELDLKYLYTGALVDFTYGQIWKAPSPPDDQKIDVTLGLEEPAGTPVHCAGWSVLHGGDVLKPVVELPSWTTNVSNLDEMLSFLEPMSSSVKLVYDSAQPPADRLSWVDDFDNRREILGVANPDYNPNPLPTWGSTPINKSLLSAYDWYVHQRTVGHWALDTSRDCRLWYIILITDGEERCPKTVPDAACVGAGADAAAALKFANPQAYGAPVNIDPVAIYTVGFSESVAADSPLQCIADLTGGAYYSATDAGQLRDVLIDVLNQMQETDRSFIPYAVSPPPPSAGGTLVNDDDFLTVFPHFVPRNDKSVWEGDLLAFKFSASQATLPTTADCAVDTSQAVWTLGGSPAGAAEILEDQITNSTRHVFMGSDYDTTGTWLRYDMLDMFTNDPLRTDFKGQLDILGGASDLEAVEIVNFVRNIRENPGGLSLSPPPQDPPRPAGYWVLGDIYHSQPVIVNPPNNFMYFSDFGLGPAHDYMSFRAKHAKRRRVVLAGANDGQLHAFDGGFFDRDETLYDEEHDLGTGKELFAWVPEAVNDRLALMAYGTEHLYMVDGLTSVSDVFIDHDGDTNREWRTVALSTMRRGGRGVLALDITTPDPIIEGNDWKPAVSEFPGCLDGTDGDCDAKYPHLLWEFHDVDNTGAPNDTDANCPHPVGDPLCRPYWDLGWTWSKPAIARVGIYAEDGGGNIVPDDVFVAVFGGGWDAAGGDYTGNYFYIVDIETGDTLVKERIGAVPIPGTPAILDSDNDGFHDKVYFGDSDGSVWRLQFPTPFVNTTTGVDQGVFRRIFQVTNTLTTDKGRQQFFYQPTLVPLLFDGANYTYAVVLGSGDRADLGSEAVAPDVMINHTYAFLDDLDNDTMANPAYDEDDLVARDYTALTNAVPPIADNCAGGSAFTTDKGWYLSLRGDEKVNYEAAVFANTVYFTSFQPTDIGAVNPPAVCTPAPGPTPTPGPTATPEPTPGPGAPVTEYCKASGVGRIYAVGLYCGLGQYTEVDDVIVGMSIYTIGDTTHFVFPTSGADAGIGEITGGMGLEIPHPNAIISSTSNWRQE